MTVHLRKLFSLFFVLNILDLPVAEAGDSLNKSFCLGVIDRLKDVKSHLSLLELVTSVFSEKAPVWYPVGGDYGYLASDIVGRPMGLVDAHLISDIEDLRFLPRMMNGMNILLVVDGIGGVSPDKIVRVGRSAKKKGIRIGIVFSGPKHELGEYQADQLRSLSLYTGGPFVNVGPQGQNCVDEARVKLAH